MRPYSQQAHVLKLGLEAGIVEHEEVIDWADGILLNYDYDDDVANIALAANASPKELMSLLGKVIDDSDVLVAIRCTMGSMYEILQAHPEKAHDFARFLENFWIQRGYEVPQDMSFMAGIEDVFQLAEQGIYGTVADARRSLVDSLAKYGRHSKPSGSA